MGILNWFKGKHSKNNLDELKLKKMIEDLTERFNKEPLLILNDVPKCEWCSIELSPLHGEDANDFEDLAKDEGAFGPQLVWKCARCRSVLVVPKTKTQGIGRCLWFRSNDGSQ